VIIDLLFEEVVKLIADEYYKLANNAGFLNFDFHLGVSY